MWVVTDSVGYVDVVSKYEVSSSEWKWKGNKNSMQWTPSEKNSNQFKTRGFPAITYLIAM